MHPCPGKLVAIRRAVVYYAQAALAFSAELNVGIVFILNLYIVFTPLTNELHWWFIILLVVTHDLLSTIGQKPQVANGAHKPFVNRSINQYYTAFIFRR